VLAPAGLGRSTSACSVVPSGSEMKSSAVQVAFAGPATVPPADADAASASEPAGSEDSDFPEEAHTPTTCAAPRTCVSAAQLDREHELADEAPVEASLERVARLERSGTVRSITGPDLPLGRRGGSAARAPRGCPSSSDHSSCRKNTRASSAGGESPVVAPETTGVHRASARGSNGPGSLADGLDDDVDGAREAGAGLERAVGAERPWPARACPPSAPSPTPAARRACQDDRGGPSRRRRPDQDGHAGFAPARVNSIR